jgi:hypothetical protein
MMRSAYDSLYNEREGLHARERQIKQTTSHETQNDVT